MTTAQLVIDQGDNDPIVMDIEVTEGMDPVVLVISADAVTFNSKVEPKVITPDPDGRAK